MWSKMDYGGVKWSVQLHVYLIYYNIVIISSNLVVYILIDML